MQLIDSYYVLVPVDFVTGIRFEGFVHIEDQAITQELAYAMKFPTALEAQSYQDRMASAWDEAGNDDRRYFYLNTMVGRIDRILTIL